MIENFLLPKLASIAPLGIAGQWIAARLHLPAILILLIIGLIAGPGLGYLDPDQLFGPLLLPIVSMSVGIILFEGGLSLKISEIKNIGREVRNLIIIGSLVSWGLMTLAINSIFSLSITVSILLGALLVVTGPTVIMPLLRQIRPRGRVATILKWEGIVIDPLGVMFGVLAFEALVLQQSASIPSLLIFGVLKTAIIGVIFGALGSFVLVAVLYYYLAPDYLMNPIALGIVLTVLATANNLQSESGLFAVTLMGIIVANQPYVSIRQLLRFKEDLTVLLIAILFILLSARIDSKAIHSVGLDYWLFFLLIVFVIRPAAVFLSTMNTGLNVKEKMFISLIAPRGIVAAAVASIFSLELLREGIEGHEELVNIVFFTIVTTVIFYSLSARFVTKVLGFSTPANSGLLVVGAHQWARELAKTLSNEGVLVRLIDSNSYNIAASVKMGLLAQHASIFSEHDSIEVGGTNKLLALTANDEVNTLAGVHFSDVYGWTNTFQLARQTHSSMQLSVSRSRLLFNEEYTFQRINSLFSGGAKFFVRQIEDQKDIDLFSSPDLEDVIPFFVISPTKGIQPFSTSISITLMTGQKVVYLGSVEKQAKQAYN